MSGVLPPKKTVVSWALADTGSGQVTRMSQELDGSINFQFSFSTLLCPI